IADATVSFSTPPGPPGAATLRPLEVATLFKGRITSPGEASGQEIDELVADIAAERPTAETAMGMLLRAGDAGARVLAMRLPGPLRARRPALGGPIAPLERYGPLLAVVPRVG